MCNIHIYFNGKLLDGKSVKKSSANQYCGFETIKNIILKEDIYIKEIKQSKKRHRCVFKNGLSDNFIYVKIISESDINNFINNLNEQYSRYWILDMIHGFGFDTNLKQLLYGSIEEIIKGCFSRRTNCHCAFIK